MSGTPPMWQRQLSEAVSPAHKHARSKAQTAMRTTPSAPTRGHEHDYRPLTTNGVPCGLEQCRGCGAFQTADYGAGRDA